VNFYWGEVMSKETLNPAIDQVLGYSAEANAFLEGEHHRLCAQLGITAKSGKRRYWLKH
jgi:hypothetical protein